MTLFRTYYPGDYNYHKETNDTVELFKKGKISEILAMKILEGIEYTAYEFDPGAEPDGDITFCVANAVHEIRGE
jgi:hypothetical protein